MKLWKRTLLKEFLLTFLLIIMGSFLLFVTLDYSMHAKVLHANIILYYLAQFSKYGEIFIPTALLIATIKVLSTSNSRNELLALKVAGISSKRILAPFLLCGVFFAALLWLNFETFQPKAFAYINHSEVKKRLKKTEVYPLMLSDSSLIVYGHFDPKEKKFSDVYWLKNFDQLFAIKNLYCDNKKPRGDEVDCIVRNSDNRMKRGEHLINYTFTDMPLETESVASLVSPPKWQSISELFQNIRGTDFSSLTNKEAAIATFLTYKLTLPLGALLAILGPAAACFTIRRGIPIFFIYAISLFSLITFFTLLNASVILGENQVVAPFVAVLTPVMLFSLIFGWNYAKI